MVSSYILNISLFIIIFVVCCKYSGWQFLFPIPSKRSRHLCHNFQLSSGNNFQFAFNLINKQNSSINLHNLLQTYIHINIHFKHLEKHQKCPLTCKYISWRRDFLLGSSDATLLARSIIDYMKCHGTQTPPVTAPRVKLLGPMVSELQSLQKLASTARKQQMRDLLKHEKNTYNAELRSTLGKSFAADDVCERHTCSGWGGRAVLYLQW